MGLTADDRIAILDLLSRYNWAIDNWTIAGQPMSSADAWAQTFTEDGRFTVERALTATESVEMSSVCGRANLRAFAENAQRARPRQGFHWVTNVIIEGDGNQATMKCYLRSVLGRDDDAPEEVVGNGYYQDQLRKVRDEWKFESRHLFVTWTK